MQDHVGHCKGVTAEICRHPTCLGSSPTFWETDVHLSKFWLSKLHMQQKLSIFPRADTQIHLKSFLIGNAICEETQQAHRVPGEFSEIILLSDLVPCLLMLRHELSQRRFQGRSNLNTKALGQNWPQLQTCTCVSREHPFCCINSTLVRV